MKLHDGKRTAWRDLTRGMRGGALFAQLTFTLLALAAASEAQATVRVLAPGETMMATPGTESTPSPLPPVDLPLAKVRIAVADGDGGKLASLSPRTAPFEIVAPSAGPDLVWDPLSHDVRSASAVVLFGVAAADLGAVIDRTAVVRALAQRKAGLLTIQSPAANTLLHKGNSVQVVIDGIKDRALLLIDIAGDGATQLLYPDPVSSDPSVPRMVPFKFELTQSEPFGTDIWVAISTAKPVEKLAARLKEARPTDAPELLALIDQTLPQDARLGLLTLTSAP